MKLIAIILGAVALGYFIVSAVTQADQQGCAMYLSMAILAKLWADDK